MAVRIGPRCAEFPFPERRRYWRSIGAGIDMCEAGATEFDVANRPDRRPSRIRLGNELRVALAFRDLVRVYDRVSCLVVRPDSGKTDICRNSIAGGR